MFSIQGLHTVYRPVPEPVPKIEPTKKFDRSEPVQKINKFNVRFVLGFFITPSPSAESIVPNCNLPRAQIFRMYSRCTFYCRGFF